MRHRLQLWRLGLLLGAGTLSTCSSPGGDAAPMFRVPDLGLELPKLSGWVEDPSIKVADFAEGGVIFRLVRESSVPLSPRIDVLLEPAKTRPSVLEEFLTQNLRDMAQLESGGSIRITQVDQRPLMLGPRRAFHVLHEYAMLSPGQAPLAITQLSTILVVDGRGVAVTAAGRTELFHPLADSVERILTGLALPVPAGSGRSRPAAVPAPARDTARPVDLGKVGGKN